MPVQNPSYYFFGVGGANQDINPAESLATPEKLPEIGIPIKPTLGGGESKKHKSLRNCIAIVPDAPVNCRAIVSIALRNCREIVLIALG